jgi:hypothetical protein
MGIEAAALREILDRMRMGNAKEGDVDFLMDLFTKMENRLFEAESLVNSLWYKIDKPLGRQR